MCRTEVVLTTKSGKTEKRKVQPDLIKFRPIEKSQCTLFALPGTRKPIDDKHLYGHEMDAADCFVALERTFGERLVRWQRHWDNTEEIVAGKTERQFFGETLGVWPDRVFEIEDSDAVFYLEVDRGTEDLRKQIWEKLECYRDLSQAAKGSTFHVLFTVQGYRYDKEDMERLNRLLPLFREMQCGNMFVAALHGDFLADPAGDIFHTPLDPAKRLSFLAL